MDTEEKIKYLSAKRNSYKGMVTYFYTKINEIKSIGEIQSALNRLRSAYVNYEQVQIELETLNNNETTDRIKFEDGYGRVESVLLDRLEEFKKHVSVDQKVLDKLSEIEIASKTVVHKSDEPDKLKFKLPDVPLVKFNGNRLKWLSFRDVFVNVIHSSDRITNVEKFYYLHGSLKDGSAYRLIETIPITDQNYEIAWNKLYDHYNNEYAIQQHHMRCIYDIKKPTENSHASLTSFVETIENNLQALEALKISHDSWSLFMNHHILERLDSVSKCEILKKLPLDKPTSTKDLLILLRARIRLLEHLNSHKMPDKSQPLNQANKHNNKFSRTMNTSSVSCLYCDESDHKLVNCSKFAGKDVLPSTRFEFIKLHKLCTNCFSTTHRVIECTSGNCKKCSMKHHTLLHFTKPHSNSKNTTEKSTNHLSKSNSTNPPASVSTILSSSNEIIHSNEQAMPNSSSFVSNVLSTTRSHDKHELITDTILATVLVWVQADKGFRIKCRALVDSGSQRNFITERMCQLLNASKRTINHPVSGFTDHISYVKSMTELNIQSSCSNFNRDLRLLVVPKICGNLPNADIDLKQINCNLDLLPSSVNLADPCFYKSEVIDMLIGVELFNDILLPDTLLFNIHLPLFRNSHLGYLVFGKLKLKKLSRSYVSQSNLSNALESPDVDLNSLLQKFWELDRLPSNPQLCWSTDEKMCEEHYVKHTTRLESGRYSVALPVKSNIELLGLSEFSALQQFYHLEKRLNSNVEFKSQYRDFMSEYLNLGHMEEVHNPKLNDNQYDKTCFLPHHAVIKESSTTTKVRVVFNASSKTSSHLCLNDVLLNGPTIQNDLFSIVIRFRIHLIGLTADITKMYRQIKLHADQRDLHRIWWRNDAHEIIKCYRLKTVTYGTKCAPFLAIRTLFKLADDEETKFPQASRILKRDFYVDDVLTGSDSVELANQIKCDLVQLLNAGNFELRKWNSNCSKLRDDDTSVSNIISILGISWNTITDSFCIKISLSETNVFTKRSILSEIAQLYDPIGFISPVIVVAKQIMQKLWLSCNTGWDDELESAIVDCWKMFRSQLTLIDSFEIPRCIKCVSSKIFEIHAFGDASEKAYGCVVYIRTLDSNDKYVVRLLCSKSKIAPLKTQTIPRLELCASLLTAELVSKVLKIFENLVTNIFYWTDSEITLCRIKSNLESNQTKLPIFEANRVSKIQELSSSLNWYYVPTQLNPADIVSRGLLASELVNCSFWWNGPEFLTMDQSYWPLQKDIKMSSSDSVIIPKVNNIVEKDIAQINLLSRYSKLFKLLRVTAYCLRFVENCRLPRHKRSTIKAFKTIEIDKALKSVIKLSQRLEFSLEIRKLSKNEYVHSKSKLKSFCPFLDSEEIIRVGGRLDNSEYEFDKKHPIVLSGSCPLSKLIAEYEHIKLLHAGPQQLLYSIRQRFWILNGRNLCKTVVHKCLKCFRAKPRSIEQLMGQLPSERVTPAKPFHHVGLDFCGPFFIKYPVRSKALTKAYICVFICFVTRACHLEVVGDLSTESFLASFRRFTSRRGRCAHVYSDNGTNFIGAKGELIELQKFLDSEYHRNEVLKFCTENSIQWHNIPPRSPHFGGLWEAAVKIAKSHIKRVVGDTSFTSEELSTLVTEIEACMNSRPLTPMSNDPSDFEVLSPAHFLIGSPMTALPDPDLLHLNYNRLKHYQQIQFLLQKFWKRWHNEVLSEMQERHKWYKEPIVLKVGMLVLLKEQNLPPLKWLTGRIIELIPGQDNVVRSVIVKTPFSTFKRAVANICILPIDDNYVENFDKLINKSNVKE